MMYSKKTCAMVRYGIGMNGMVLMMLASFPRKEYGCCQAWWQHPVPRKELCQRACYSIYIITICRTTIEKDDGALAVAT